MTRRGPRPLALAFAVLRDDLAPETVLADAQRAWAEAVGPAVAAEAQPVSERAGVLTISCSSSVWAQELDLMAQAVLERVNGLVSGGRITRLRCVSTPPRLDS